MKDGTRKLGWPSLTSISIESHAFSVNARLPARPNTVSLISVCPYFQKFFFA